VLDVSSVAVLTFSPLFEVLRKVGTGLALGCFIMCSSSSASTSSSCVHSPLLGLASAQWPLLGSTSVPTFGPVRCRRELSTNPYKVGPAPEVKEPGAMPGEQGPPVHLQEDTRLGVVPAQHRVDRPAATPCGGLPRSAVHLVGG
jgi:hypothetical protein